MAKNNNLKDFLTDVADAIREKKGTSSKINPQDFSAEIKSIEGGGGSIESREYKDVNFFDYEGTILYSYTWEEAQALTEMPPLPNHDGLICQGWNWTYEELQEAGGFADIGAMYITDDGKTKLLISIPDNNRIEVPLKIGQTVSNGIVVNWGDGSEEETISGTGNVTITHSYKEKGNYRISLEVINGSLFLGHNGSPVTINPYKFYIKGIHTGNGFTNLRNGSLMSTSIKFITLHNGVKDFSTSCCSGCYSLNHITIPNSVKSTINQCLKNCYALKSISFPYAIGSIGTQSFYSCNTLQARFNLKNVTTIESNTFYQCVSLVSFKVPPLVTNIGTNTFNQCSSMRFYNFTELSSVPTLANINAFTGIPADCEIRVPKALEEEWKAATNWSTYADYIVGIETNN
jgi:hypothetical protein